MANTAKSVMDKAISYIGTKENPAGSNKVIFNKDYYGTNVSGSAYPWCCSFVWDIFRMCGMSKLFYDGKKTAYCPTVENWGKANKLTVNKNDGRYGDIVLFDFYGKGVSCHIGFIEKKNANGTYTCVEGNTSVSSNDNGGSVMRRTRNVSSIRCIIRPRYDASAPSKKTKTDASKSTTTKNTYSAKDFTKDIQKAVGVAVDGDCGSKTLDALPLVKTNLNNKHKVVSYLQKRLNALGYDCGAVDGNFGSKSKAAAMKFQKTKKLVADGEVGRNTWLALCK